MASRLARLNGWQRLWLVGTICLGLWFIGWWPLMQAGEQHFRSWDYRQTIEKEFANPACRDYQVLPTAALREPAYGQACYHIYLSRKYDDTGTVPYTLAVYDGNRDTHWRNVYLAGLGIGVVGTVTLSALVYLVGWVIAWILRGFRRTAS
jgi:hypothetical protein